MNVVQIFGTPTVGCFANGSNLCYLYSFTGNEDMVADVGFQGVSEYLVLDTPTFAPPPVQAVPELSVVASMALGLMVIWLFIRRRH